MSEQRELIAEPPYLLVRMSPDLVTQTMSRDYDGNLLTHSLERLDDGTFNLILTRHTDDNIVAAARTELAAWHSAFGTTQLTHAVARLEAAERARPDRAEVERLLDELMVLAADGNDEWSDKVRKNLLDYVCGPEESCPTS